MARDLELTPVRAIDALDDAHHHAACSLAVLRRLAEGSLSTDGDDQRLFWEGVADMVDAVTADLVTIRDKADRLFELAKTEGAR